MCPVWGHRLRSPCGARAQGQSGRCLCPAALTLPKADGGRATWGLPWQVWPGCAQTLDSSLDPEVHAVSAARISRKAGPGAPEPSPPGRSSRSSRYVPCQMYLFPLLLPFSQSSQPSLRSFTGCDCVHTHTPATCLVLGHLRTVRLWR